VQVVANPLISLLGPPQTVDSRLTFVQAFNSLGTTVFTYVGSILILGGLAKVSASDFSGAALDAYCARETHAIVAAYLGLAGALLVCRGRLISSQSTGAIAGFTLLAIGLMNAIMFSTIF
jgi:FHS family L-fucose permease-like MFS transporter